MKEGRKEELASSREQLLRALRLAAFLTLCLKDLLLQIVRSREEAWQKKPGSLRLASCKGRGLAPLRMLLPFSTQILLSHLPHYALIVSSKDAFPTAAPEIVAKTHFQQLHRERSSKTKNHGVRRRRRTTTTAHVLHQIRWNKSAFSGIFRRRRPLLLQRCKKHKEIAIETQTKNVRGRDDTR